jgi:FtsH-binding integral membrane protein
MTVHTIALALLVAFIAATFLESFLKVDRKIHQAIYWSCTAAAAVSGFFVAYPNIKEGVLAVVFVVAALVSVAYFTTSYIRVRGHTYADTAIGNEADADEVEGEPRNAGRDDSYSGVYSPPKFWWGMVPVALIMTAAVVLSASGQKPWWYALIGVGLLVLMAPTSGLGDSSWGYAIARGQYLPFALVGLVTAGSFTVLYLVAYYVGRRWPVRRRQSMEYRAHARHQRPERPR